MYQSTSTLANQQPVSGPDRLESLPALQDLIETKAARKQSQAVGKAKASAERHSPEQQESLSPNNAFKKQMAALSSKQAEQMQARFDRFELESRVWFLRWSNLQEYPVLIRTIWGAHTLPTTWEWGEAKKRAGWNSSNWKARSIERMQVGLILCLLYTTVS